MRQIRKKNEPPSLTHWRAAYVNDVNFGYNLIDGDLRLEIKRALLVEQGGIRAYTGQAISENTSHIEHPKAQRHCGRGEDVAYQNMLACLPAPNRPSLPYGAHKKGDWPDVAQEMLFVSPLRPGCGTRFLFTLRGEMRPMNPGDLAARETIFRLGLDHPRLIQLRKAAIEGTLSIRARGPASLDLRSSRSRLKSLVRAEQLNSTLEPFCFVLQQALQKHIQRVNAIRVSKRGRE
jgi:uncharacterized protein (TIGR02646 family)